MEKSIYEQKPWLKSYPADIPPDIEVPNKSLIESFDEATDRWKKRTALNFYGAEISYQDLREKADRMAAALHDLGIKKGDRVAMLLLNSPEYVIAFYALIKVGAIITPISPVYVSKEVKHQVEDSGATSVICQDILYENLEKADLKFQNVILCNISDSLPKLMKLIGKSILKSFYQRMAAPAPDIYLQDGFYRMHELIKSHKATPPKIDINVKEDVIMLPYTGGTTGQPKGVMLTHYNMIAAWEMVRRYFPMLEAGKENALAYMPFYHAAGHITCVITGILQGCTSTVLTTPDIDDILNSISKNRITHFLGAPAIFETFIDHEKTGRVDWKKLKYVMSGADSLNESTAEGWKNRVGIDLINGYGMTETSGTGICIPVGVKRKDSIGLPMSGTMAAIIDPFEDKYVTANEIGELVIAGPEVTLGYWKNEAATKECEAFINGIRWWRTGDLARMDEDGFVYVYDRKRDLIKYKGLRVYAREVEEVLTTHPKIKEVGVVGVKDVKVGENVKAFVVLEGEARGNLSEVDIIDYCQDKLAPYKIPRIIEFVGEIPKTDIGKVSRRELREQE